MLILYFCRVFSTKTIAFHTLGCKLNFSETSSISRLLEKDGFQKVSFEDAADVYVINTCSVTDQAEKECRQIVRKALKYSPNARIAVIGCYAQLKPDEIASIKGVDLVLGANEKFRLADYLKLLPEKKSIDQRGTVFSCDINDVHLFESSFSFGEKTRAFLKVQDGCDYSCTYCTIPLARGKSRSDSIDHAVEQAHLLASLGIKEIVLTGVNIGDFGIENSLSGKRVSSFFDLIQKLDAVKGIDRFRISSIEPNLLREEIIRFVSASEKFMPHFHIPLQSGSDHILKRMKRRYLSDIYSDRVENILSLMPHSSIGADVIMGFPGENENEFLKTYHFINQLDISYLHVFTYSEREHTEATMMDEPVPINVRHERTRMLRILSEKKKRAFQGKNIGDIRNVLFERPSVAGIAEGFTDNYIKVHVISQDSHHGKILPVKISEAVDGKIYGTIYQPEAVATKSKTIFTNASV